MAKGPPRLLTPNRLLLCGLINQLATPGLGSYMAGRKIAGVGQLVLSVGGFVLITTWMFLTFYNVFLSQMGETPRRPAEWLWTGGWILFSTSWCWSLVTSAAIWLQAYRLGQKDRRMLSKSFETGKSGAGVSVGMASMHKIIGADGRQYGPITADQMRSWLSEGRVNGETMVQTAGSEQWALLSTFPEFQPEPKPPVTSFTQPVNRPGPQSASSKIPAGIFGILLGSLGIHKFILGYTRAGLIMLLATILTCGIAAPITLMIGLVEGIIYLCKSDEEFVHTYVNGRREWF